MRNPKRKSLRAAAIVFVTCIGLAVFIGWLNSNQYKQIELEWEKVESEEIQTVIKETEQKEDLPVNGIVSECEQETVERETVELTFEEAQLLMKIAQAEAGNQGPDGMWLVMSVVLNRVRDESFPNSITDVVYQKARTKKGNTVHQFSSVADKRIEEQTVLSKEAHEALARIESGDVAAEIIAFEVKDSTALDKYFKYAFTFRDHRFYTKK